MQRRLFLRGGLAAGAAGMAATAGLLTPSAVLAAWPKAAFESKKAEDAIKAIGGGAAPTESAEIKIKAPDIAENGAVVPVTISTEMADVESISVIVPNNPVPLVSSTVLGEGALPYVASRIKMGKTSDVVAVVKAGGKLYSAKKQVKVTIGGCGG
jgi:sulfur-oxidizing protein SoxY